MDRRDGWLEELEHPGTGFFPAFAARVGAAGPESAVCDAVQRVAPGVDWATYLPHVPHGLLGLSAVFRLKPLLEESSFLRILATQIHMLAHEGRAQALRSLGAIGCGSGNWTNLRMAVELHKPAIAYGEALGVANPEREDFRRIGGWVAADMANVGHKAVMARGLDSLHQALGRPAEVGRTLLGITSWLAASEPSDLFWNQRIAKRLDDATATVHYHAPELGEEAHACLARTICDAGLVELLDVLAERVRTGLGSGDLLAALALAAAEKQLDARRDLEGKTAWNFVYLATVQEARKAGPWLQAAALVNLFPSDEEADRLKAGGAQGATPEGLLDSLLDGEASRAMAQVSHLRGAAGDEAALRVLAEAASVNDPAFNHSHQVLAVAAAADLIPHLPGHAREALLTSLAKFLANSQGSCDLGRLAQRALSEAL